MSWWFQVLILMIIIYVVDLITKRFFPKKQKQKKKTSFERKLDDRYAQSKQRLYAQQAENDDATSTPKMKNFCGIETDLNVDENTIDILEAIALPQMSEEQKKQYMAKKQIYNNAKHKEMEDIATLMSKRVVQLGGTIPAQSTVNDIENDTILLNEINEVKKNLFKISETKNENADAAETALKKLGYKPKDIKDVMTALRVSMPTLSVEDYIKKAINLLS